MISIDQLRKIMPYNAGRVIMFASAIAAALAEFDICTPRRVAAFIAQAAHESGELRYMRELDSGEAYEGRKDLGNTQPGDGARFRGGGLLGLTGRGNWDRCGLALNLPLIANPSLIEIPGPASRSAGWIWKTKGLNELADQNKFFEITHHINGGYTGGDLRLGYYLVSRSVLGL